MIFLINGKARSGKDTIADYIVKQTGAKKLWFAKPLKDYCIKYFDLTEDECYDNKTELSRRVLQAVGKMFRDEINKNYWVNQVVNQINLYSKNINVQDRNNNFIISDCRYKNEIIELSRKFDQNNFDNLIGKLNIDVWEKYKTEYYGSESSEVISEVYPNIGCITIKIVRNSGPKIEYGENHDSENDLNSFKFDYLIENNGTLNDLYKSVDKLIYNTVSI